VSRDYELAIILSPEVNEEETRSFLKRLEQIVTNYEGQLVRTTQWGRRRLAYPIQHHRDGCYVFLDLILTPEAVAELERTLRVAEFVLRHMMRRLEPKIAKMRRDAIIAAEAAAARKAEAEAEEAAKQAETAAAEAEAAKQAEIAAKTVEAETVVTTVQVETPAVAIEAETVVTAVEVAPAAQAQTEGTPAESGTPAPSAPAEAPVAAALA
jgi:small subunit ribosomal protein S6